MYQVVLCTCPTAEIAEVISHTLVEKKLAACVNLLPQVRSIYLWQGKIEQDQEIQLIIKTTKTLFAELEKIIVQLHPYDVPEIIALDIKHGHQPYINWIDESLK